MDTSSTRGIWAVALLAVGSLFFFNCKRAAEKAPHKMVETLVEEVAGQEEEVVQTGEKPTFMMGENTSLSAYSTNTWPEDIPTEVPKLDKLKITDTAKSESIESESWTVFFEGFSAGILDAYDAELKKAGFKTALFKLDDDGGSVTGEKGKLTVSCMAGADGTMLSVVRRKN